MEGRDERKDGVKITFSCAGKIGGLGQEYITSNTGMASVRMGSLNQLFSCDFDEGLGETAEKAVKVGALNEFEIAHGLLARLLNRSGLTYYVSNSFYDNKVAGMIEPCDIFHGFASQSLKTMIKAKKMGAKIVADNPNTHPSNIRKILTEEYKIWRVPYPAYNKIAMNRRLRALEIADRVLLLSTDSYRSFIDNGYPAESLRIVPYGVDGELFRPRPKRDDKFRVLFIGQICLRKGFQYLLEAWRLLGLKEAELVLAGSCKPDALYALRKYEGKIDFRIKEPLSRMSEIAEFYNQASIAVFPSIEEGFGMVVTEAMASGLPVVVSQNVGAKDLINNGEEGFIVPIRNAQAITDAILHLYEDRNKRSQMGRKARISIENQTWKGYQDKLIDAYKELSGEQV